jgi:3-hydroxyisobutyrate dehydrogenase-like beta-hydroxyacid dehydrogenase
MHDDDSHSTPAKKEAKGSTAPSGRAPPVARTLEGSIGFIGLGHMGSAMAANLAAGGRAVIGYLRQPERNAELQALGIKPTNKLADLFDCDIVITMLPDDAAAHEIVFGGSSPARAGLASDLKPGALHLSMSTISPAMSSNIAAEHALRGQNYVAAPVFGNPDAAKARELFIIAAGQSDQVDRCRPIFDLVGQRTFVIGSDPASVNLVKLAGNAMTATSLEVLGEVLALLRKRGVEPEKFIDIMTSTMFDSHVHKIYGAKMVHKRYAPGFAFPLALKDVRLVLSEADAASVPMPSVGVVHDRLIAGVARGHAGLDWSALALIAAEEAGLESDSLKSGA